MYVLHYDLYESDFVNISSLSVRIACNLLNVEIPIRSTLLRSPDKVNISHLDFPLHTILKLMWDHRFAETFHIKPPTFDEIHILTHSYLHVQFQEKIFSACGKYGRSYANRSSFAQNWRLAWGTLTRTRSQCLR